VLPRLFFLQRWCVLLGSESHASGRSDTNVHDLGTGDDIDGLVGVLRDVVLSRAIVLYEDVVDWVIQVRSDHGTDPRHGWRELEERGRSVGWMPVDWVTVGQYIGESGLRIRRGKICQ